MRLKFYAKPDHSVHYPGPKKARQIPNYVGRQFVATEDELVARATRNAGQNRATKDAFEIEHETPEGRDLAHSARAGGLWCADKATADAVGAPFVEVKYDDKAFEWLPAAAPSRSSIKPPAQSE